LKVVVADNLAPFVDTGFSTPAETMSALDVWTLAFLFGFQIYFDFSAYSQIALGSARLMGIRFPDNFNFPYLASSPKDFWRRWHISLSSWIRDYLYIPLTGAKFHDRSTGGLGNAVAEKKQTGVLFTTWALMGLWHGANWTFVVWGLYHAVVAYAHRLISPSTTRLDHRLRWLGGIALTLPIMMLGWIPFRADSLSTTLTMWSKVVDPWAYGSLGLRESYYLAATVVLLAMFTVYGISRIAADRDRGPALIAGETVVFALVIPVTLIFLRPITQFIYFQF
jgi:D-alanyl-lipoteichoic acid acyltransferase DltB (MBOAT superfamily)